MTGIWKKVRGWVRQVLCSASVYHCPVIGPSPCGKLVSGVIGGRKKNRSEGCVFRAGYLKEPRSVGAGQSPAWSVPKPGELLVDEGVSWALLRAPTLVADSWPSLNSISVGMPRMPNLGNFAVSSTFILAMDSLPW